MFYRRLFDFPTRGLRSPFGELDQLRHRMDEIRRLVRRSLSNTFGRCFSFDQCD